jgi:hypothetical protein
MNEHPRDNDRVDTRYALDSISKEVGYMVNDLRHIAQADDSLSEPARRLMLVAACLIQDVDRERVTCICMLKDVDECECGILVRKEDDA